MTSNIETIQPYLFFNGRCEEALNFYRKTVGAETVMLMRFKESPDQSMVAPGTGDKVMHLSFRIGNTTLMASDGQCQGTAKFEGFALTFNARNEAEADTVFADLSQGGQVQMPMTKTFFSPRFGMVADRFGVSWMVIVPQNKP